MNRKEVMACRKSNIERLAQLGGGDEQRANAKSLYNRLVRFALRRYRWATIDVSENLTGYQLQQHNHEGNLIANLGKRLNNELLGYGLTITYPGLYPCVTDMHGNHEIELY